MLSKEEGELAKERECVVTVDAPEKPSNEIMFEQRYRSFLADVRTSTSHGQSSEFSFLYKLKTERGVNA